MYGRKLHGSNRKKVNVFEKSLRDWRHWKPLSRKQIFLNDHSKAWQWKRSKGAQCIMKWEYLVDVVQGLRYTVTDSVIARSVAIMLCHHQSSNIFTVYVVYRMKCVMCCMKRFNFKLMKSTAVLKFLENSWEQQYALESTHILVSCFFVWCTLSINIMFQLMFLLTLHVNIFPLTQCNKMYWIYFPSSLHSILKLPIPLSTQLCLWMKVQVHCFYGKVFSSGEFHYMLTWVVTSDLNSFD
jgi:hypothetical protein